MASLFKQSYIPYMMFLGGVVLIFLWARSRQSAEGFADAATAADGKPFSFTMYYADWCPHCHRAKPEFDKLGTIQTIGGKKVEMRAVEADANPQEIKAKNISGYPTFHLYDGKGVLLEEYKGDRSLEAFQSFLAGALKK